MSYIIIKTGICAKTACPSSSQYHFIMARIFARVSKQKGVSTKKPYQPSVGYAPLKFCLRAQKSLIIPPRGKRLKLIIYAGTGRQIGDLS